MNAARAASLTTAPTSAGSCEAVANAPPSVAFADSATSGETDAGMASPSIVRYTATPMLPNSAIPSAPPNSAEVSERPEAAPARSGGADPMMRSVVRVKTGDEPIENTNVAIAKYTIVVAGPTPATITSPRPESANPQPMRCEGRTRRASLGVTNDPTMNASIHGNIHSPASNGDSPRMSWRYCGRKKKPPNIMRIVRPYVASDAANAGVWKRRMSISGSSSENWRLTNSTPRLTPATMAITAVMVTPSCAISLSP